MNPPHSRSSGELVILTTKNSGTYYFLAPLQPASVNPSIWIPDGHGLSWDVIPKFLGIDRRKVDAVAYYGIPRYVIPATLNEHVTGCYSVSPLDQTKKNIAASRNRWIPAFLTALMVMRATWKLVAPRSRTSAYMQSWLAFGLDKHVESADYILRNSGAMNHDGLPRNPENYYSELMILIHWGGIWRLRKIRKGEDTQNPSAGGVGLDCAAASLTKVCQYGLPGWADSGWSSITAAAIERVRDKYLLDARLP